ESELAALYDRCAVRLVTEYINDRDSFRKLISSPTPTVPHVTIDFATEQAACRAVTVPDDVYEAITTLRYKVRDAGFKVSDRKWRQCVGLVKAAAHLEGRTVASTEDLECLEDVLWRAPEEKTQITRIIQEVSNPSGAKAVADLDAARQLRASLPTLDAKDPNSSTHFLGKAASVNKDLKDIAVRLDTYPTSRKVTDVRVQVAAIRKELTKLTSQAAGLPTD